jgi:hypothetical protein
MKISHDCQPSMEILMKRLLVTLSFVLALTFTSSLFAQSPATTKELSEKQVVALIASAKSPADHERIAQYYDARSKSYLAQATEHQQMAVAYKANTATNNSKFATGTVNHCEYLAKSFQSHARHMQELAQLHQDMARGAR